MTANALRPESNAVPVDPQLAAAILAVFAQIDAMARRAEPRCRDCRFRKGWDRLYGKPAHPHCNKGYMPLDLRDGCDDWAARGELL